MPDNNAASEKKRLPLADGIKAACMLFELNIKESDILEMAERAGLAPGKNHWCDQTVDHSVLITEWRAFTHAAVVYALMAEAPNAVVVGYLHATRELLERQGMLPADVDAFIDNSFAPYLRLMAQNRQRECPARFYEKVLHIQDITKLPSERVAFLAGMMAITMCTLLDKVCNYEFLAD